MTRSSNAALPLLLCCVALSCSMVGLCCVAITAAQPEPHPETYLAVSDKPYVEIAESAQEAANDWQAEQESYYYVQSYYDSEYDDLDDRDYIAQRESGQSYDARNGQYIGKYQLQEGMLDGDYSPENQERAAEAYMLERYGSWEAARAFWDAHGWW